MKIRYNDKYDIYRNGNYIDSFDNMTQVENFFEKTYENQEKWKEMTGVNPIPYMNSQRFSIIQSKWPVFSE